MAHKPIESFLKNTLAGDAVLRENSIQAGLSGGGLPATVEQFNEALADASDQVAVQANLGNLTFERNGGVSLSPFCAVGDGAVHLGFNLAHGVG